LRCACPSGDSRAAASSRTGWPLPAQALDDGVEVTGIPQHDGVEDQAEGGELIFLAFAIGLPDLAAVAVADLAGEAVAGFLHGELPVHPPLAAAVNGVDEREQVQGLGDPAVLNERLPERGGVSVAAEHPQQVAGADLAGDQRPGHAQHVWPSGGDLGDVDRVAGDRLQRRGNKRPR
jgi:hypothetical protein